jgi:diadenosine tetraphosphate (Ap4A) HIT family hydrolase
MPGRRKKIMFELDYRLQNDCVEVGTLMVSRILLMKDANYPWLILVPQRENISEIYQQSSNIM